MPIFVEILPSAYQMAKVYPTSRSTNPDDYQKVPRPVAAMSKTFKDGSKIAPHQHSRDQFL